MNAKVLVSNEYIDSLLALDDGTLAHLYSEWSEEYWCAGWMMDGEPHMTEALLAAEWPHEEPYTYCECDYRLRPLPQYAQDGVAVIRRILAAAKR